MNEREVSWAAIVAATCLVFGLCVGAVAVFTDSWDSLAFAGVLELAGIGWALLAWRDDR